MLMCSPCENLSSNVLKSYPVLLEMTLSNESIKKQFEITKYSNFQGIKI